MNLEDPVKKPSGLIGFAQEPSVSPANSGSHRQEANSFAS